MVFRLVFVLDFYCNLSKLSRVVQVLFNEWSCDFLWQGDHWDGWKGKFLGDLYCILFVFQSMGLPVSFGPYITWTHFSVYYVQATQLFYYSLCCSHLFLLPEQHLLAKGDIITFWVENWVFWKLIFLSSHVCLITYLLIYFFYLLAESVYLSNC